MCEPLLAHAEHLFTTRDWTLGRGTPTSAADGWAEVAEALGVSLATVKRKLARIACRVFAMAESDQRLVEYSGRFARAGANDG